jgi:hypothetical protein
MEDDFTLHDGTLAQVSEFNNFKYIHENFGIRCKYSIYFYTRFF